MALRWVGLASLLALAGFGLWVYSRAAGREALAEQSHPPLGQILRVNGTQIHARVQGDGPDLVLIHGASGNMRDFTFGLVDQLAQDFRVITFDRPGLGYSGRTDPGYDKAWTTKAESPAEQAAVLAAAARQLGADRPIVVGHSFGGAVTLAWGLYEDAAALVSLGGAAMPWPGELGRNYTLLGSGPGGAIIPPFVSAFMSEAQVKTALVEIFEPQPAPDGYGDYVGAGLSLRRDTLRANAKQVNTLRPHLVTMSALYSEIRLPVEFVHGDADTIVPLTVHSGPASKIIPDANLTVLPGVGHMPQHADPDATIAAIHRAAARAGLR